MENLNFKNEKEFQENNYSFHNFETSEIEGLIPENLLNNGAPFRKKINKFEFSIVTRNGKSQVFLNTENFFQTRNLRSVEEIKKCVNFLLKN